MRLDSVRALQGNSFPLLITALILADAIAAFESLMIIAALKVIHAEFSNPVGVAWLVTGYMLVGAVAGGICGRLGDLYGRKRILLIALLLACFGSILSALSTHLAWVILGRAIQGVAGAVLPLCYGILHEKVPAERRGVAGGLLVSASSFGVLIGLVFGGFIVDNLPWRVLFWVSAGFTAIAAIVVYLVVPETMRRAHSANLDYGGGLLFIAATGCLLFTVSRMQDFSLEDMQMIAAAAASAVLIAGWLWYEVRHKNPLFSVRLLARRDIAMTNLSMFFTSMSLFQVPLVIIMLMQQSPATGIGFGLTAAAAGAVKVPSQIAGLLAAPGAGHFGRLIGEKFVIVLGTCLGVASLAVLLTYHDRFWVVLVATIFATIGSTTAMVGINNNIMRIAPDGRASEANGLTGTIRYVGAACGAQIVTILLGSAVMKETGSGAALASAAATYTSVFLVVIGLGITGMLFALAIPRRRRSPPGNPDAHGTDH